MSWVDTCGVNRVKTVPVSRLVSAARWGVGMSPVFDLFLADDSIVSSELQGGPDGDLRLVPGPRPGGRRSPGSPAGPGRRWTG